MYARSDNIFDICEMCRTLARYFKIKVVIPSTKNILIRQLHPNNLIDITDCPVTELDCSAVTSIINLNFINWTTRAVTCSKLTQSPRNWRLVVRNHPVLGLKEIGRIDDRNEA